MPQTMTKAELLATKPRKPWAYGLRAARLGKPGPEGLVTVALPQVADLPPYHRARWAVHEKVAPMLVRAFELIDACGLLASLRSFDGCYALRQTRGGGSVSTHAWGAAVDLNARWNPLGATPAPDGQPGSVLPIVGIMAACGFGWGGLWRRPDGMHFEPWRIMATDELPTMEQPNGWHVLAGGQRLDADTRDGVCWTPLRPLVEALGGTIAGTPRSGLIVTVAGKAALLPPDVVQLRGSSTWVQVRRFADLLLLTVAVSGTEVRVR